jgi:5-methylcytosine-specific restriction enzyme subunit McrC
MRRRSEGVQAQFRISGQETIIETASVDVTKGDNMIARLRRIIASATEDALV